MCCCASLHAARIRAFGPDLSTSLPWSGRERRGAGPRGSYPDRSALILPAEASRLPEIGSETALGEHRDPGTPTCAATPQHISLLAVACSSIPPRPRAARPGFGTKAAGFWRQAASRHAELARSCHHCSCRSPHPQGQVAKGPQRHICIAAIGPFCARPREPGVDRRRTTSIRVRPLADFDLTRHPVLTRPAANHALRGEDLRAEKVGLAAQTGG